MLKDDDDKIFYAGSTNDPDARLSQHKETYGNNITMEVANKVKFIYNHELYKLEMALIHRLINEGHSLTNKFLLPKGNTKKDINKHVKLLIPAQLLHDIDLSKDIVTLYEYAYVNNKITSRRVRLRRPNNCSNNMWRSKVFERATPLGYK